MLNRKKERVRLIGRLKNIPSKLRLKNGAKQLAQTIYDEEFDPGSGWTLAAGLTHASRGVLGACS